MINKYHMKKLQKTYSSLLLLFMLAISVVFAGCKKKEEGDSGNQANANTDIEALKHNTIQLKAKLYDKITNKGETP